MFSFGTGKRMARMPRASRLDSTERDVAVFPADDRCFRVVQDCAWQGCHAPVDQITQSGMWGIFPAGDRRFYLTQESAWQGCHAPVDQITQRDVSLMTLAKHQQ